MTRADRRRPLRAAGAVASALAVFALTVAFGLAGGPSRAAANPSGASPEVYVGGSNVVRLQLGSVEGGGASSNVVLNETPAQENCNFSYGPVAINADATRAIVGGNCRDSQMPSQWQLVNARTGTLVGTFSSQPANVRAIAMDPVNPSLAYAIENDVVDQLNLSTLSDSAWVTKFSPPRTPAPNLTSIAVSPNGTTLYVGGELAQSEAVIYSVPIGDVSAISEWQTAAIDEGVHDLQVAPDGRRIYATVEDSSREAELAAVSVPLPKAGTAIPPVHFLSVGSSTPVTVSPDSSTVYVGSDTGYGVSATVNSYSATTGVQTGTARVAIDAAVGPGEGIQGLAITPDGREMIASGVDVVFREDGFTFTTTLYPLRLPALTVGAVTTLPDATFINGPQAIAITPDQAPTAHFNVALAQAGHATTFDANPSSVAYGSVTRFAWNFGDGQTGSTGPTISHTFATAGAYNVTLTETDSAGTSIPPAVGGTSFAVDGPGQTSFRRASPSARTTQTVDIPSTPPPPTTAPPHKAGAPTLTLNPGVGPPGTIVIVTGSGFKASTPITIAWSVSTGSVVVTSDAHGNLSPTQMFILTPDVLGPRFAVASSSPKVEAPFLVVPGTMQPGGDDASLLFRSEGS